MTPSQTLLQFPDRQRQAALLACQIVGKPLRNNIIYVDRSRIQSREKCPTDRYLNYCYDLPNQHLDKEIGIATVPGIQRIARSVPLCTGIAVHHGIAGLAALVQSNPAQPFTPEQVDDSVTAALAEYDKVLANRGFSQGISATSGEVSWIIAEQRALTEALVRVAALRVLPPFLNSSHKIISVEKERVTWLGEDLATNTTILLLTRADLEMYDQENKYLYVINFKTAKTWDDRDQDRLTINMQNMCEPKALQATLQAHFSGKLQPEFAGLDFAPTTSVAGVQYIVLLKGESRYDNHRGHDVTYSHLTRAWTSLDHVTGRMQYAWRYHHEGSKRQVMSKATGFHPFESYPGGTSQWIDDLAGGMIWGEAGTIGQWHNATDRGLLLGGETQSDPLSECVVMPAMCYSHPYRLQEWQDQTVRDELRFQQDLQQDRPMSKHTGHCGTGKWKCQFWPVCHEQADIVASGLYEARQANHETEEAGDS